MHKCPYCALEYRSFAFYCLRCGRCIGKVGVDGVMVCLYWLDSNSSLESKFCEKTLKHGLNYLDVSSVTPEFPRGSETVFLFTTPDGKELHQNLIDFFNQAMNPTQEWNIV
jgi:hypothetical protein